MGRDSRTRNRFSTRASRSSSPKNTAVLSMAGREKEEWKGMENWSRETRATVASLWRITPSASPPPMPSRAVYRLSQHWIRAMFPLPMPRML